MCVCVSFLYLYPNKTPPSPYYYPFKPFACILRFRFLIFPLFISQPFLFAQFCLIIIGAIKQSNMAWLHAYSRATSEKQILTSLCFPPKQTRKENNCFRIQSDGQHYFRMTLDDPPKLDLTWDTCPNVTYIDSQSIDEQHVCVLFFDSFLRSKVRSSEEQTHTHTHTHTHMCTMYIANGHALRSTAYVHFPAFAQFFLLFKPETFFIAQFYVCWHTFWLSRLPLA